MKKIAVINGPNLNLIGIREPEIYGTRSLEDFLKTLKENNDDVNLIFFQSNIEGELVSFLHSCMYETDGVILNAGSYSHTSIAIADAISAIKTPVIEVHISNVLAREDFRKTSFIASKCIGSISGLGLTGYELALAYFMSLSEPL